MEISPRLEEPRLVVVPATVRAAADTDEFGTLLPPPKCVQQEAEYVQSNGAAAGDQANAASSSGHRETQAPRPAAGPLVVRIPAPASQAAPAPEPQAVAGPIPAGAAPPAERLPLMRVSHVRSFDSGRVNVVTGVLGPAASAPFDGVRHRLVQTGKTVCFLLSARADVTLDPLVGRRVEVVGIEADHALGPDTRLLQVCAVHPVD
jgi:hypothetical protein